MRSLGEVQQERQRLESEYAPKIAEARQEVEDASAAFEEARARRDAAVDAHLKLVNQFEDARVLVGKR